MSRNYFENLKNHILPLSKASDFDIAKKEWIVDHIYKTDDYERCPCSTPIIEHCAIRNMLNGNMTFVGNVCMKRFMDIDTNKLFAGLKKIENNSHAIPNRDLIEYAQRSRYLYDDREYLFLKSIENASELSDKQKQWLYFINRRIIGKITVRQLPNLNKVNVDLFNVTCKEERINVANKHRLNHRASFGSDAQYNDQESDGETSSEADNDSDFIVDEESEDDWVSDASSESDNDYYATSTGNEESEERILSSNDEDYSDTDDDFELDNDDESTEYEEDDEQSNSQSYEGEKITLKRSYCDDGSISSEYFEVKKFKRY